MVLNPAPQNDSAIFRDSVSKLRDSGHRDYKLSTPSQLLVSKYLFHTLDPVFPIDNDE